MLGVIMLIFSSFQFAVLFLLFFQEVMQTFYSHGNITDIFMLPVWRISRFTIINNIKYLTLLF